MFGEGFHPQHHLQNTESSWSPIVLEPVGLNRGDGKRPDGISIFRFSCGKSIWWDSTCVNTFSDSSIINSAIEAGSAAKVSESQKRRKYLSLVQRFQFETIVIETSGVYGSSTSNYSGTR